MSAIPVTPSEREIRAAIDDWTRALCARDLDAMMSHTSQGVTLFDVMAPGCTAGSDAVRKVWEQALPHFPETFQVERRELRVHVDGDLAVAHFLFHFTCPDPGHPVAQSWMRGTVAYQKREGRWLSIHEHVSLPLDPATGRAASAIAPAAD